ncbi:UNKNOWN [Stylonychia lemnae]|uniref:Glycosyltransferase 2-like domain-containing protein n=1 Tax=Stylonychia lemnae TaxID=5949 RepID=A0A077ZSX6_STYLE|nr:UNKNOWN [Stylonychia lemnae]|eukprot:CDW72415.1 UNKNOWN [Stylonychia lemnae]
MRGQFITLYHVKTISFPERFNQLSTVLRSNQILALVSDLEIKNHKNEHLSNKQPILRDYSRKEIVKKSRHLNRFEILKQIRQNGNIFQIPDKLISMTFDDYKKKYTNDFVLIPQNDNIQYLLIDSYLRLENPTQDMLKSIREKMVQLNQNIRHQERVAKNPSYFPLVSVVMASHDRDYFFLEAVRSVFQLTYTNWELLIVDDASQNPLTYSILHLLEWHPKIRVSYLDTNWYCSFTNNFALAQLKGDFFALLDDDDIMVEDRLERQLSYMQNYPELDLIGANGLFYNEIGNYLYGLSSDYLNHWDVKISLAVQCHFTHSTLMVRMNKKMKEHFYYVHSSGPDYRTWFKLLFDLEHENIKMGILPGYAIALREHGKRMSYADYFSSIHIGNWIPAKQSEAYLKLSPKIYDMISSECFSSVYFHLTRRYMPIRSCDGFDIEKITNAILEHQQSKSYYSQADIKELNSTLQKYKQVYNQAQVENQITIVPKKKIHACIFYHQNDERVLQQIESLKDIVEEFIIISIPDEQNFDVQENLLMPNQQLNLRE